jgi:hypothetical protein
MRSVFLIPLYKPAGRHILLLQSALSACPAGQGHVFLVVADGPNSEVEWNKDALARLQAMAEDKEIQLRLYSRLRASGYPGCFRELMVDALGIEDVQVIHFIDQDDYCLPLRFSPRALDATMASSTLVVNQYFDVLTMHRFDESVRTGLLETPSQGMTFSTTPAMVRKYLKLCVDLPEAAAAPHDYVIAQLAIHDGTMKRALGPSMVYIQHADNAIGYVSGPQWVLRKLQTFSQVMARTLRHARILDHIYGNTHWTRHAALHRNPLRSLLYRAILTLAR